ncbi:MAG: HTH domain-containing protein [Thermoplasmata archaeon]|nr:MAG: HTH domain-containing protein [Thermoplasmata archaeon]
MNRGSMKLLEAISSNADLIESLKGGLKHPKEMADEFGISRVAIDKRLKKLKKLGLIEPVPSVSKNSDRTVIKYRLSQACLQLLDSIENNINEFYHYNLRELDILLAIRKINESEYLERKMKLELEIKRMKGEA